MKINENTQIGNTGYTVADLVGLLNNREVLFSGLQSDGYVQLSKKSTDYQRLAILLNANNSKCWFYIDEIHAGQMYGFIFDGEPGAPNNIFVEKLTIVLYENSIYIKENLFAGGAVDHNLLVGRSDWYKIKIEKVVGYKL